MDRKRGRGRRERGGGGWDKKVGGGWRRGERTGGEIRSSFNEHSKEAKTWRARAESDGEQGYSVQASQQTGQSDQTRRDQTGQVRERCERSWGELGVLGPAAVVLEITWLL